MKKEPPINLAKYKIGQRVKMSDGRITKIIAIDKNSKEWPLSLENCGWYNNKGDSIVPTCQPAVISILPLPKKKAPPRLQKALKLPAPLDKQAIKAAIKTLQALLK